MQSLRPKREQERTLEMLFEHLQIILAGWSWIDFQSQWRPGDVDKETEFKAYRWVNINESIRMAFGRAVDSISEYSVAGVLKAVEVQWFGSYT